MSLLTIIIARSLRQQTVSLQATPPSLLHAWRTLSARLGTEDTAHLAAREAAAVSILDKLHHEETPSRPPKEVGSEATAQLYEMITQLARLTRDLLPGVGEAKAVVLYVPRGTQPA